MLYLSLSLIMSLLEFQRIVHKKESLQQNKKRQHNKKLHCINLNKKTLNVNFSSVISTIFCNVKERIPGPKSLHTADNTKAKKHTVIAACNIQFLFTYLDLINRQYLK